MSAPIPVTVLTGFLGAGKTTLLRALLREVGGERIVVVENEFGAANIDSEFLEEIAPGMVRKVNGCICCAVQIDLQHTFRSLLEAKDDGQIDFERVILETTGMADVGGVVETFLRGDDLGRAFAIDAVICVVDARHIAIDMQNSPVAQAQIALADVLVLNKLDLVESVTEIAAQLSIANPMAHQIQTTHAQVPAAQILDLKAFGRFPRAIRPPTHIHDPFGSVLLEDDGPHDIRKLRAWIGRFARERTYDLYRYKGVIHAAGKARRIALQGVHDLFSVEAARPWRPEEPRRTTIVMIGIDLDEAELQAALEATRGRAASKKAIR